MQLTLQALQNTAWFKERDISLPAFDVERMRANTQKTPVWLHFGAGNIFRAFTARIAQSLLNKGDMNSGIIVCETFDEELIPSTYDANDLLTLLVSLPADGQPSYSVIASVAQAINATCNMLPETRATLMDILSAPTLQMVSFTITEKGYAVKDASGNPLSYIERDIHSGPLDATSTMGLLCAGLLKRYEEGKAPLTLVSMDNCAFNGDKLKEAVRFFINVWVEKNMAPAEILSYVEHSLSFPLSMIDKITPRPDIGIAKALKEMGLEGMTPLVTAKNTHTAAYVNAEDVEYLVVEDVFPHGRPPLENAGVYMTDRETVNRVERMKVSTCLNPLHTALAILGCLFGYERISDEMRDKHLVALLKRLVYMEGMPVVTDPGIISPVNFANEVLHKRFPNPYVPDIPQRIATDTSQKIPVRFGETVKEYLRRNLDTHELQAIPFVLAAWMRYLTGKDDNLQEMALSPDPLLSELQPLFTSLAFGVPLDESALQPFFDRQDLLGGLSIQEAGLQPRVWRWFTCMMEGKGAVRAALETITEQWK